MTTDNYSFDNPDRKAIRIDPDKTFKCTIILTPEMQKKIRASADPDCMICLGRGLYQAATGWAMCSCVDPDNQR